MSRNISIRAPYVLFVGDMRDRNYAKTAFGIAHWRPDRVVGQIRSDEQAADLGVPDLSVEGAVAAGAKSLVVGVATVGGVIPDDWWRVIVAAAEAGLDIVSGLHGRLADNETLKNAAAASGARLIDVRAAPKDLTVGTGRRRSGKRVLMVGTDCAVGKKYSALALDQALREIGVRSTFRATGQTGIMIAGEGIAVDAVVADFISGAAELISPDNDDDHWDVIEGQGSLFHPGYAGVSLGLLHGSQPDAVVVCHEADREVTEGWPEFRLPGIAECIDLALQLGRRTNPGVRCVGVSVNTSALAAGERQDWLAALEEEIGLPCVDPVIDGCERIARVIAGDN